LSGPMRFGAQLKLMAVNRWRISAKCFELGTKTKSQ
jgi:hypothetical protein